MVYNLVLVVAVFTIGFSAVYYVLKLFGYFGGHIEQHPKGGWYKTYVWLNGNIVNSYSDPLESITAEQIKWRREEASVELKRWKEIYKKANL